MINDMLKPRHMSLKYFCSLHNTIVLLKWIKGVNFWRNCGAELVGEYNRTIKFYQLSWKCKWATEKSFKADIASGSPFVRATGLCMFTCRKWSYGISVNRWQENKNKSVEWKVLVDTKGIKSAVWKINFFLRLEVNGFSSVQSFKLMTHTLLWLPESWLLSQWPTEQTSAKHLVCVDRLAPLIGCQY